MPQLLKPVRLEAEPQNERGHHGERPAHATQEWSPALRTERKPACSDGDHCRQIKGTALRVKDTGMDNA